MLRYKRFLSAAAFEYLNTDGAFIIPEIKTARRTDEPFCLDIHLRENDTLMVYMGTTRVLKLKINIKTKKLVFTADKAYSDEFLISYDFDHAPKGKIIQYLHKAMPNVNQKYFDNKKEGYYQNMTCYLHGENAADSSPFIVFDRECVIGFRDITEKTKCFNPIADKYQGIKNRLQKLDSNKYGKPADNKLGNELDLLGIDSNLNLLCIELKHGSNSSGIYWGPLQVAVYRELFNSINSQDFFNDVRTLIMQKIALNLLPHKTATFYEAHDKFNKILPVLGVGAPNYKMNCWKMMSNIIDNSKYDLSCDVLRIEKDGKISPITI
jgi:hypothetical protein